MKLYIHVDFILFTYVILSAKKGIVRFKLNTCPISIKIWHLSANLSKNQKHENTTDMKLICSDIF